MSISAISAGSVDQSTLIAMLKQSREDLASLASDVQSGNISAAQTALAAFQHDVVNITAGAAGSITVGTAGPPVPPATLASSSATPPQTTFQSDFSTLVSAVQSGDIAGAQSALTALQAARTPSTTGYGSQAIGTPSGPQSDLQSLLQAVQNGNLVGAQTALTALQADNQALLTGATGNSGTTGVPAPAAVTTPVHHHRHGGGGHRGGGSASSSSTASSTSSSSTSSSSTSSTTSSDSGVS